MARILGRPYLVRNCWRVDLGQGPVDLCGVPATPDAEDLAYRAALQLVIAYRPSPSSNQLALIDPSVEITIRGAAMAYRQRAQPAATPGGQKWRDQYLRAVVSELGGERLSAFAPPGGNVRLNQYFLRLRERGFSPKTIRGRLSLLGQVLRDAAVHGELPGLPLMPRVAGCALRSVEYPRIAERDLRAIMNQVTVQRRTYLSVGFYLGLHTADIETFSIDCLLSGDAWIRRNTKSRSVPDAQFPLPRACAADLDLAVSELGSDPLRGLTGGPWSHRDEQLGPICRELGVVVPCGRILRRSCVWELASRGWSERECAEYLGHVDQRMVREVYVRFPVRERPQIRVPWDQLQMAHN